MDRCPRYPAKKGPWMAGLILICLMLAPLQGRAEGPAYEIYALKYAETREMPAFLFFLYGNPPFAADQPKVPVAFYLWLIKGPKERILFDAGMTPEAAKRFNLSNYTNPQEMLAHLKLKPEQIDRVVVSHGHFDHLNGITLFPKARILVQKAFYDAVVAGPKYAFYRQMGFPSQPEDAEALKRSKAQGRLRLMEGDTVIAPGIRALRVDGHFPGHSILVVNTAKGPVVLTSDAVYLYENLEKDWPIGLIMTDLDDVMRGMARVRRLGGVMVPGHDPKIMEKFPAAGPNIVKIAP
ncbi:MAG: N-acyl homoserine lactonase family protein [Candidatus Tectomicrobia bacterium]|uniref:N-acyl homoserine lactonase family protein n=1 Tax=Tectimicrobiota bacterium TaxID=2528274 RepID=A0A932FXN5_UNCTE|nr:N-acyl homoserine lactonase family protein [Candidatus Tectomicrobia bacterium]